MSKRQDDPTISVFVWLIFACIAIAILFLAATTILYALPSFLLSLPILHDMVTNSVRLPRIIKIAGYLKVAAILCFLTAMYYIAALPKGIPGYLDWKVVLASAFAGFFFSVWVVSSSKEIKKRLAGLKAEESVRQILLSVEESVGGEARHGLLMVFNRGSQNEYSAEFDHLLITKRNIYVIETKYKSGAILAKENASLWTVTVGENISDMRNALFQAKNSIGALRKNITPLRSARIVPIVAIVGKNVEIIDGPSNVVEASDLSKVIMAFEANTNGVDIDVGSLLAEINKFIVDDDKSLRAHITRIKEREAKAGSQREKSEQAMLVSLASTSSEKKSTVAQQGEQVPASEQSPAGLKYLAEPARHNLAALAGMQELKNQLAEAGQSAALMSGQTTSSLAGECLNGILLYGDPGNGKTLIAEGLAGTMGLPIIKMSFGSVASKWLNQTTEQVVELFVDARKQAPCVLFMDEVDSVICSRDFTAGSSEEGPKITNQILTELVATRGTGVVIIMATNFLERLDAAAIREGRIDFKIQVPPPDFQARQALIKARIRKAPMSVNLPDSACDLAARRWEGFSAARIVSVIDECVRVAIRGMKPEVSFDDLQAALKKIQGKLGERLSEDTPPLADLHMPDTQKTNLLGIAKRMTDIEKVEALGGSVPTGLMLAGPPGTGKTLSVRALAKTTGWPLLSSTGADLLSDVRKIDELILRARNARPCIVFIDEADDVFANRRNGSLFSASVTNKLLTSIDGVGGKQHDILWVIAVNAPDTLDPAALRGGRFTEKIWFDYPDVDVVMLIVAQWMDKIPAQFESSLTPGALAHMLKGESPANIKAILQQAVNQMISRTESNPDDQTVKLPDVISAQKIILGAP